MITGFVLYRLNRRDTEIADFRETIASSRTIVERLESLVGFEVGDELVCETVYSGSMRVPIESLFAAYFANHDELPAELKADILKRLGPVTVAAKSDIARGYEAAVATLSAHAARYQTAYPGFYRVLRSIAAVYGNILNAEKALARDEKVWAELLEEIVTEKRAEVRTIAQLEYHLTRALIGGSYYVATEARKQVGDLAPILDLVGEAYLALDEGQLQKVSRRERGESLIPVSSTKLISEDLREAEKALQHVLSAKDRLLYREIITRFEERQPESKENDDEHEEDA